MKFISPVVLLKMLLFGFGENNFTVYGLQFYGFGFFMRRVLFSSEAVDTGRPYFKHARPDDRSDGNCLWILMVEVNIEERRILGFTISNFLLSNSWLT
jgi:hypothetical protein